MFYNIFNIFFFIYLLFVFLEPEPLTSSSQIAVFTRMWHPSTFQLDPFKEIILENDSFECLIKKV